MMPRSRSVIRSLIFVFLLACNAPASDPGGVAQGETTAVTSGPGPTDAAAPDTPTTGAALDPTTSATTSATTSTASTGAADETTTASAGTTGAPPVCGDGHVDPGEICDWGYGLNSDDGACTTHCEKAVCGDGLVWAGEEECDAGADNNDENYGGCTTQCTLAAGCGDGQVQGPEECDQGDLNGSGAHATDGVPCTQTCRFAAFQVFLSSAVYQGGQLGGSDKADIVCQQLAKGAALDNALNFRAWISDDYSSPALRFKKGAPGVPYVRPDGIRVADDYDHLIQFGPIAGITVTETGQTLLNVPVWTATAPDGTPIDGDVDCYSWTTSSAQFKGRVGRSGVDKQDPAEWQSGQWTDYITLGCYLKSHIYCVEQ